MLSEVPEYKNQNPAKNGFTIRPKHTVPLYFNAHLCLFFNPWVSVFFTEKLFLNLNICYYITEKL